MMATRCCWALAQAASKTPREMANPRARSGTTIARVDAAQRLCKVIQRQSGSAEQRELMFRGREHRRQHWQASPVAQRTQSFHTRQLACRTARRTQNAGAAASPPTERRGAASRAAAASSAGAPAARAARRAGAARQAVACRAARLACCPAATDGRRIGGGASGEDAGDQSRPAAAGGAHGALACSLEGALPSGELPVAACAPAPACSAAAMPPPSLLELARCDRPLAPRACTPLLLQGKELHEHHPEVFDGY